MWGVISFILVNLVLIVFCLLLTYYFMIVAIFMCDEYDSKKVLIKDLIPFYGFYRLVRNSFNSLGD